MYPTSSCACLIAFPQAFLDVSPLLPSVPGVPPLNVLAFTETSTSISVRWSPPPVEFLYGIPRGYRIRYTPLHANGSLRMALFANVPYANTSDLLVGLEEFTNYSIEVAAVTIDAGVYSDPIVNETEQDSKAGHSFEYALFMMAT